MEIRPAREGELAALLRIQLLALGLDDLLETFPAGEVPALYRHGYEHGETLVALDAGAPVGFSVGYERDGTWFLGEFFVLPETQSGGIGQALLDRAMPAHRHCATVATSDYRAQALYARFGLTPLWPSFQLRAEPAQLRRPTSDEFIVREAGSTPTFNAWDAAISGRNRPEDIDFLIDSWNGLCLWIEYAGRRVGYAGIARRGGGRVTIGPVGVNDPAHAAGAVRAVVAFAAESEEVDSITVDVPGPHPALAPLLEAGARIADQNLFCSSDAARFGDPRAYIPLTPAIY